MDPKGCHLNCQGFVTRNPIITGHQRWEVGHQKNYNSETWGQFNVALGASQAYIAREEQSLGLQRLMESSVGHLWKFAS